MSPSLLLKASSPRRRSPSPLLPMPARAVLSASFYFAAGMQFCRGGATMSPSLLLKASSSRRRSPCTTTRVVAKVRFTCRAGLAFRPSRQRRSRTRSHSNAAAAAAAASSYSGRRPRRQRGNGSRTAAVAAQRDACRRVQQQRCVDMMRHANQRCFVCDDDLARGSAHSDCVDRAKRYQISTQHRLRVATNGHRP